MRLVSVLMCLAMALTTHSHASTLKPFTTDGCSMWFDGTLEQPNLWRHCCVAHDLDYWQGGTEEQRLRSDEAIRACVSNAQGKAMAEYMYANIRWGGSPFWMTTYRWGYGWDYWDGFLQRGYKTPTPQEQAQLDALMPAAKQLVAEDALSHPLTKAIPPADSHSLLPETPQAPELKPKPDESGRGKKTAQ